MSWIYAAVTVATTVGGMAYNSSQSKKARKRNEGRLRAGEEAGAFDPLAIPEPQELDVPSAEEILAAWRGEVLTNFPEYDKISGKLNVSEQEAARVANKMANPQYYSLLDRLSVNASEAAQGKLPTDVKQNILRNANEDAYLRGFSYGTGNGSGGNVFAGGNDAAANLALRNLGLSSLDMMKYGNSLTGNVLDQSRASRGQVLSAKDTVPTTAIFQDQMNMEAIAQYNFASDKAAFEAASHNAPIQAGYNKLALQMGIGTQNAALSAQTGASNMQLALSAMQALGKGFSGGSTIGSTTRQTAPTATYDYTQGYLGNSADFTGASMNGGLYYNQFGKPIAEAATITAVN